MLVIVGATRSVVNEPVDGADKLPAASIVYTLYVEPVIIFALLALTETFVFVLAPATAAVAKPTVPILEYVTVVLVVTSTTYNVCVASFD